MSQTLEVKTMIDEIRSYWIDMPRENQVKMMINSIINQINSIIGARESILVITGTAANWEDIEANWEDVETNWGALGRFLEGFNYDPTDNAIIIPTNIMKVSNLWVNDNLYSARSYEYVKGASQYTRVYCQVGDRIYMPYDISTDKATIKMRVKKYFPNIDDAGYVTLPPTFRSLLIAGAISRLATTKKYRDDILYTVHNQEYEKHLALMRAYENSFGSPDVINYGAADDILGGTADYAYDYGINFYRGLL